MCPCKKYCIISTNIVFVHESTYKFTYENHIDFSKQMGAGWWMNGYNLRAKAKTRWHFEFTMAHVFQRRYMFLDVVGSYLQVYGFDAPSSMRCRNNLTTQWFKCTVGIPKVSHSVMHANTPHHSWWLLNRTSRTQLGKYYSALKNMVACDCVAVMNDGAKAWPILAWHLHMQTSATYSIWVFIGT